MTEYSHALSNYQRALENRRAARHALELAEALLRRANEEFAEAERRMHATFNAQQENA